MLKLLKLGAFPSFPYSVIEFHSITFYKHSGPANPIPSYYARTAFGLLGDLGDIGSSRIVNFLWIFHN